MPFEPILCLKNESEYFKEKTLVEIEDINLQEVAGEGIRMEAKGVPMIGYEKVYALMWEGNDGNIEGVIQDYEVVLKNQGLAESEIEEVDFEDNYDNDGAIVWDENAIPANEDYEVVESI